MSDAELLTEHIRAIEYLLKSGTLTERDKRDAKARLMVMVGLLRMGGEQVFRYDDTRMEEP